MDSRDSELFAQDQTSGNPQSKNSDQDLTWKFMLWITLYSAVSVLWYSLCKMKYNVFLQSFQQNWI